MITENKNLEALLAESEKAAAKAAEAARIAAEAEQAYVTAENAIKAQKAAEEAAKAAEENAKIEAEAAEAAKKQAEAEEKLKKEAIDGHPMTGPNQELNASVETSFELVTARNQIRINPTVYKWSTVGFIAGAISRAKVAAMNRLLRDEKTTRYKHLEQAQKSGDISAAIAAASQLQGLEGINDNYPLPEIPADDLNKTIANAHAALFGVRAMIEFATPRPLLNIALMNRHPFAMGKATDAEREALQAWDLFHDRFREWQNRVNDLMNRGPLQDPLGYLVMCHNLVSERDGFTAEADRLKDLIKVADSQYKDPFTA